MRTTTPSKERVISRPPRLAGPGADEQAGRVTLGRALAPAHHATAHHSTLRARGAGSCFLGLLLAPLPPPESRPASPKTHVP